AATQSGSRARHQAKSRYECISICSTAAQVGKPHIGDALPLSGLNLPDHHSSEPSYTTYQSSCATRHSLAILASASILPPGSHPSEITLAQALQTSQLAPDLQNPQS